MREIAKERKISLQELGKIAEKDNKIDKILDKKQIQLKNKDNFIIDGRLSFHFIPNSIKIFLDASLEVRSKRIYKDIKKDLRKEEQTKTLKEIIKKIKRRELSETKRYKKYYNLNPYKKENYDIIIDTSKLNVKEIIDKILKQLPKQQH